MCGILGYIGEKNGTHFLLKGLSMLEYRGYDSVGIGTYVQQKSKLFKTSGSVTKFKQNFGSQFENFEIKIGIGHTRWATHGAPTALNAHPHVSFSDRFMIIHNGIVENYIQLKEYLADKNIHQKSQTDTEIFVNYLDYQLQNDSLENTQLLCKVLNQIHGSFAVVLIDKKNLDKIFLFRKKSPLIIGLDEEKNFYAASDINALHGFVHQVALMPENTIVVADKNKNISAVSIINQQHNKINFKKFVSPDFSLDLDGYKHFMLKEIEEQPAIIKALISEYFNQKEKCINNKLFKKETLNHFKNIDKIYLIGCGTSFHAAKFGEYIFEEIEGVSVFSESGGEYKYRNIQVSKKALYIFISQSGETADLIGPIEILKEKGAYTLAICNVLNSSLSQIASDVCYMKAGPEISVASTKAFSAQLILLYLIAQKIAEIKNQKLNAFDEFILHAENFQIKAEHIFNQKMVYQNIAENKIVKQNVILFIGRNINYPIALEGALKLKEISYKNCDGMQMGELKHGPLALIDEHSITIACESKIHLYDKYISNIQEVLSRNGFVISIIPDNFPSIKEESVTELSYPNQHPIFNTIFNVFILQLLSYYSALSLGVDIDKPRNLAKSVTVE